MKTTFLVLSVCFLLGTSTRAYNTRVWEPVIFSEESPAIDPPSLGNAVSLQTRPAAGLATFTVPTSSAGVPASVFENEFWLICCLILILGAILEGSRSFTLAKMRRSLAEVASSNHRLAVLNDEKNELLCMTAHDLKNPLTVIIFSAEMMKSSCDPGQLNKLSKIILSAGVRMQELITSLLEANAMERGQTSPIVAPCDVSALVDLCLEQNQPLAARKNIAIRAEVTEGIWANANRAATLQVLDNLVSNALKFSPSFTAIHVRTMVEREHAVISIRDEGPGISDDDQTKLFRKNAQLNAQPTGGESSTRLGLSITKRLAESMGGTVRCQSRLGQGATFTLRLPACPPASLPVVPKILRFSGVQMDARCTDRVTSGTFTAVAGG